MLMAFPILTSNGSVYRYNGTLYSFRLAPQPTVIQIVATSYNRRHGNGTWCPDIIDDRHRQVEFGWKMEEVYDVDGALLKHGHFIMIATWKMFMMPMGIYYTLKNGR